jgi:hypothetical protein
MMPEVVRYREPMHMLSLIGFVAMMQAGPVKPVCSVQVFLSHDCPCNVLCKDELNEIAAELRASNIRFSGITDLPSREAAELAVQLALSFPLDGDPYLKRIHAAHVRYSLELAVLDAKNRIVKLYSGYNSDTIKELSTRLTSLLHRPVNLDPSKFPTLRRIGCAFEQTQTH